MKKRDVAAMIDHTILKPEATKADVKRIIEEGAAAGTFSVCVSPSMLPLDVPEGLKVACVVGFPSGAVKPQVKAFEAAQAVADGADEIDMVINIELVKDSRLHELREEIAAVRRVVPAPRVLKVIIESAALSDNEIIAACMAAKAAGADFVKTSTGFHPAGGASTHAVTLMRATVGDALGVKASGGIRDAETALAMSKQLDAVVVLKGHRTLTATPAGRLYENRTGNAGLARGGSGDVLAGMIAGLAAQGLAPAQAAVCGVYLHGLAADRCAARLSQQGMLPEDILADLCALYLENGR